MKGRRRDFLRVIGVGLVTAAAGCMNTGDETESQPPADESGTTDTDDSSTDGTGTTGDETREPPEAYVVDLKDANGDDIGNYSTEQEWDDHRFDREALYENYVSEWHQAAVYDQVIQELENNNQEKYNGNNQGFLFSNQESAEGYGYWNTERFEQLEQLQDILMDSQAATRIHQEQVHPTAYSNWNHRFAATIQRVSNTFNGELNQYQEQNNEKAFRATFVNENTHGTVITHTDLENTDIEADHPWQFVDTTSDKIEPITEDINTGGTFNPFVDGYQAEDQTHLGYEREKKSAIGSLQSFIDQTGDSDNLQRRKLGISDNILEEIFNDHIPSGGSIDPILDMFEKAADVQLETEKYVQLYGESLAEYHLAVGDEELYNMGMTPGSNVGAEEVEEYISEHQ